MFLDPKNFFRPKTFLNLQNIFRPKKYFRSKKKNEHSKRDI